MKNQPIMLPMKFKPMLAIGLTMLLCTTRSSIAQTTPPPDGDGTVITPVTSDPTPTTPPVLTPSSQVIVTGGAPISATPIAFVPPAVATNAPTLVYVSPVAVVPPGINSPAPPPSASPAVVIIPKTQPAFRRAIMAPNRFIIVRPGPPMLKPPQR